MCNRNHDDGKKRSELAGKNAKKLENPIRPDSQESRGCWLKQNEC